MTLKKEKDPKKPEEFRLCYTVSKEYKLLFYDMVKDDEAKAKKWKDEHSEMVNVIYSIVSQRMLRSKS